jgi:hypothetical protein
MTSARLDGLYLLLIGSMVFVLLGVALAIATPTPVTDFRALYYPARCLIQHHDPYLQSEVLRIYQAEGGDHPWDTKETRQVATQNPYPPTAFTFTVPLAMLPWGMAQIIWITLTAGSLIFASFLIWNLGAEYAPILSGAMIGFLLANSEFLLVTGNVAGIAISLCAVAVWCFFRERFVAAGILCLAVSLVVKPHDAGLVWLFFLLAGGVYRKRALQTLLVTVALSLPGILWVWLVAPHWIQEMHTNILAYSMHGGTNDPRVAATGPKGIIDLQSIISVFRDDPRIYNSASYLVCAPLLLIWGFLTLRSHSSQARTWLALAAISAFSMLPVYHRQYDAKLLLLTVPACAMLWAEGGLIGWLALLVNTAGFVVTGDLPWEFFLAFIKSFHLLTPGLSGRMLLVALIASAPLILLVMGVFYLWVYVRRWSASTVSAGSGGLGETPVAPALTDSGMYRKRQIGTMIPSLLDATQRKRDGA